MAGAIMLSILADLCINRRLQSAECGQLQVSWI